MTPRIRAGSAVLIRTYVYDYTPVPPVLFDPTSVKLTLLKPDDTEALSEVNADKQSVGIYQYIYQSDAADPLGLWSVIWKVTEDSTVTETLEQVAFELLED